MAKKKVAKQAPAKKAAPAKKSSSGAGGFASARVERLIRDAGAFRVSADAVDGLNNELTEYSLKLSKYAVEICNNSGRKTVKSDDIRLAASKM
jgi:histone H3/H4